jgi:ELWxxDGT repeat protein
MKKTTTLFIALWAMLLCAYAQNPVMVKDITPGINPTNLYTNEFYPVDQYLYFINEDDTAIWRTDGTNAGTLRMFSFANLSANWTDRPFGFLKASGKIFFVMSINYDTMGLYTFTHTSTTPTLLRKFKSISVPGTAGNPMDRLRQLVVYKDKLYFNAADYYIGSIVNNKGKELWVSDGTLAGTQMLIDINPGNMGFNTDSDPTGFVEAYGKLFFAARVWSGSSTRYVLYESNGTTVGTQPYQFGTVVLTSTSASSYSGYAYQLYNGTLYITVADFITPGSDLSTVYKIVNNAAPKSFSVYKLSGYGFSGGNMVFGGIPYAKGPADTTGGELYMTDTLLNGSSTTTLLKNIAVGVGGYGSGPYNFTTLNNKLYFTANEPSQRIQIWKTDLTANGTVQVSQIPVTQNVYNSFFSFTAFNGKLYFEADDSTHGNELYVLNPANDSVSYWDINPGTNPGFINANSTNQFVKAGAVLYFTASDDTHGMELWKLGDNTVGIKPVSTNAGVKVSVYPNPASNYLHLAVEGVQNPGLLLIDLTGKTIELKSTGNNTINTEGIPAGFYAYRVVNGTQVMGSGNILIQH